MPRPKILPENRIRAYRACDLCKASKTRCDANIPCSNCVKRGRSGKCAYRTNTAATGRRGARHGSRQDTRQPGPTSPPPLLSPASNIHIAEPGAVASGSPSCRSLATASPFSTGVASSSSTAAATGGIASTEDEESPQEHFITTSSGEKENRAVYIGEHTSLSFLDFLRQVLRPLVGATPFTDNELQNLILDSDVREVTPASCRADPEEELALFQSYREVSSGILHLFSAAEVESLLATDTTSAHKPEDLAAIDAALAIGAQAQSSTRCDAELAAMYFSRAREVGFRDMLANPSLSIVRLFLLLSFFTLGACRQNAASIYLGIASKAAVVLGLHQPQSWKEPHQESGPGLRMRAWHSLCILDVLTSSVLGRPCGVPRATRHTIQSLPLHTEEPAFNAMLRGVALLDDICCVVNRGVMIDVPTAQDLLHRLRSWCEDIPPSLRRFSHRGGSQLGCSDRRSLFGSVYLSGMYYFAVILVTRPFLIESFMARIRQRSGPPPASADPARASLVQVCMSSAAYMGHLCRQIISVTTTSTLPLGSLSLFNPWGFGAGLILGFSICAGETRCDLNEAFSGALHLLTKIGESSPQSKLYSETLKSFADSISLYQRLTFHKARRSAEQYVEQVFVIDLDEEVSWPPVGAPDLASLLPTGWDSLLPMSDLVGNEDPGFTLPTDLDEHMLDLEGWGDLGTQFSDNFAIDLGAGLL